MKKLVLKKNEDRRLRRGHLWVFSNEVTDLSGFRPGELANVQSQNGRFLGVAYVNPHSLICARVLCRTERPVDQAFLTERLQAALRWRDRYIGGDVYRLFYSEADGFPGLIVDRYGDRVVVQAQTQGAYQRLNLVVHALREALTPVAIVLRNDSPIVRLEGLEQERRMLLGAEPAPVDFTLDGVTFRADLWGGQKTGFYLDQRENRRALAPYVDGAEVLDAYSYSGAWGLMAARFGAAHVTCVDSSEDAIGFARHGADANGWGDRFAFEQGDVEAALHAYAAAGRAFDVICLDPPPFARQRSHLRQALEKYQRLNALAMKLVRPGGMLITSSCSSQVSRSDFEQRLARAAERAQRPAQLIEFRGQARDHPVVLPMRETAYLKCAVLRVQ